MDGSITIIYGTRHIHVLGSWFISQEKIFIESQATVCSINKHYTDYIFVRH